MTHTFKHIEANDIKNFKLLASMHHLRWQVFHEELNWTAGLTNRNCMEFDEYDRSYAHYIVRINENEEVDACCRLIATNKPYMLSEHYPEFIETRTPPQTDKIWEVSRLATSKTARKESKGLILAQMIVAMIEFGLHNDVENFISLTNEHVIPAIKRVGWDYTMLGEKRRTPDDQAYSIIQDVTFEMLEKIKRKNGIQEHILYDFDKTKNMISEVLGNGQEITQEPSITITESQLGPTGLT